MEVIGKHDPGQDVEGPVPFRGPHGLAQNLDMIDKRGAPFLGKADGEEDGANRRARAAIMRHAPTLGDPRLTAGNRGAFTAFPCQSPPYLSYDHLRTNLSIDNPVFLHRLTVLDPDVTRRVAAFPWATSI